MRRYTVVLYRDFQYEGSSYCGVFHVTAGDRNEAEDQAREKYREQFYRQHDFLPWADEWHSTVFKGWLEEVTCE